MLRISIGNGQEEADSRGFPEGSRARQEETRGGGHGYLGSCLQRPLFISSPPGCQDDTEVTQIIEQLQCPILGHWKGTFFLQMHFPSPPIKVRINSFAGFVCVSAGYFRSFLYSEGQFYLMTTTKATYSRYLVLNKTKKLMAGRRVGP